MLVRVDLAAIGTGIQSTTIDTTTAGFTSFPVASASWRAESGSGRGRGGGANGGQVASGPDGIEGGHGVVGG